VQRYKTVALQDVAVMLSSTANFVISIFLLQRIIKPTIGGSSGIETDAIVKFNFTCEPTELQNGSDPFSGRMA